jgi:hypothetical protein
MTSKPERDPAVLRAIAVLSDPAATEFEKLKAIEQASFEIASRGPVRTIQGMNADDFVKMVRVREAKTLAAVEDIERAGGLNEFESKMLDVARHQLKKGDGSVASYIVSCLAKATGVRGAQ